MDDVGRKDVEGQMDDVERKDDDDSEFYMHLFEERHEGDQCPWSAAFQERELFRSELFNVLVALHVALRMVESTEGEDADSTLIIESGQAV